MKNKIVTSLHRYIVTSLFLVCVYARADLTAIVTPGYQFPLDGSIAPSYMLLNELGMPTIQIFGTVGGSNTLAADSVTGAQLANSVPDGVTIGWNANNPRQLQVLTTGIYGAGLIPASTNTLQIFVDPTFFALATNSIGNPALNTGGPTNWLTLQPQSLTDTNISPAAGIQESKLESFTNGLYVIGSTNGGAPQEIVLPSSTFAIVLQTNPATGGSNLTLTLPILSSMTNLATSPVALSPGLMVNSAHGYTNTPTARWVLVCQTNTAGFTVGDELPVEDFYIVNSGLIQNPAFAGGANATNVFLSFFGTGVGAFHVLSKTTGADTGVSAPNWKAKCYVRP